MAKPPARMNAGTHKLVFSIPGGTVERFGSSLTCAPDGVPALSLNFGATAKNV